VVTDAERDAAVKLLTRHCGDGRITLDELEDRIGEVYAATTPADLRHALRELPPFRDEPAPEVHREPAPRHAHRPRRRRAAPARRCGPGGVATAPAVLIALIAVLFATSHVVLAVLLLVFLLRRGPVARRRLLHA
jgi:hypothetical protein